MGIEAATFISELVATNPVGAVDDYATADDHLRLIKSVLQSQFPNFTALAVNPSSVELNLLVGLLASSAELNTLDGFTGNTADLNVVSGAAAGGLTAAELLFVADVTSAIQAQLNGKAASVHTHDTVDIVNNAITLPKLLDIVTSSFLGRITAATGDPEVLTAAQARTVLGIEAGSTADQTAAEIEAIVNHDNLLGFLAAEHVDWAAAGAENIEAGRSINGALALSAGEITQLANIGATVISAADWVAVAALVGVNTGDEPAASLTVQGIVELATIAETNTGADATRGVTPDGLDGWTGSAQLATSSNAVLALTAGEVTQLANIGATVISAADWTAVAALLGINTGDEPVASETVQGIVERATQAEVDAGTDTTRYISPATLTGITDPGVTKVKTADTPRPSDSTLSDDPHLAGWNLVAGKRYSIEGFIAYTQDIGDIKFRWDLSNTEQSAKWLDFATDSVSTRDSGIKAAMITTEVISNMGDGNDAGIILSGGFQANASTGGTLDFQWSQRVIETNPTTVYEDSWITITQLD